MIHSTFIRLEGYIRLEYDLKKVYVIFLSEIMSWYSSYSIYVAPRNLGVQLTLFQPGGADYAHHITTCPPEFENLTASLILNNESWTYESWFFYENEIDIYIYIMKQRFK